MPYIVTQSEKKDFPKPKDGEYIAICYKLIDMGTHKNKHGNMQPSIRLAWELHGDSIVGEGTGYMDDGKPFSVDRVFNPYLGSPSKATKFREFLEKWRGRPFTEEELKGFDLTNLLGAACRITLATSTNDEGKEYQNVVSASPMMKGVAKPQQVNPSFLFLLPPRGEFDQAKFDKLPEFMRKRISESHEMNAGALEQKSALAADPLHPFDGDYDPTVVDMNA